MKALMQAHFVPTNYLCSVFDRLRQLKQGSLSVDALIKEMELLMQRSRVQESIQITLQRFLHGLRLPIKNIVMHHTYNDMNQLLLLGFGADNKIFIPYRTLNCTDLSI
jgi:hypothetical protein